MRARALAAVVFVAAACGVDVSKDIPAGLQLSCATSNDCPAEMTCDAALNVCWKPGAAARADGQGCGTSGDCASGHCVLDVCCADACVDQGSESCGTTGACDVATASPTFGQCALYPAATQCQAPLCSGGQFTPAQTCAGDGSTCPAGTPGACTGNTACQDGTSCVPSCTKGTQSGCMGAAWCRDIGAGVLACVTGQQQNGDSCSLNTDCASTHCNGGLCCGGGTCCNGTTANCPTDFKECTSTVACTGLSHTYSCPTTGGSAYSCVDTTASDATACTGIQCKGAACASGQLTPPQSCTGGAGCPAGVSATCPGSTACLDGSTCIGSCTLGTQTGCTSDKWCRSSAGGPTCMAGSQVAGDSCNVAGDCTTGRCNNNICCATGTCCNGTIANCPANTNVCTNVPTCAGQSHTYSCPTSGGSAFSCVDTPAVTTVCNGQTANPCGFYKDAVCPNSTCATVCTTDADCDANAWCSSGACVARFAAGTACTASNQCLSGTTCGGTNPSYCPTGFTCGTSAKVCCSGARCCNNANLGTVCGQYFTCDTGSTCSGTGHVATCSSNNCNFTTLTTPVDDRACGSTFTATCPGGINNVACNGSSDQSAICPTSCRGYVLQCGGFPLNCTQVCSSLNNCKVGYACMTGVGCFGSCYRILIGP